MSGEKFETVYKKFIHRPYNLSAYSQHFTSVEVSMHKIKLTYITNPKSHRNAQEQTKQVKTSEGTEARVYIYTDQLPVTVAPPGLASVLHLPLFSNFAPFGSLLSQLYLYSLNSNTNFSNYPISSHPNNRIKQTKTPRLQKKPLFAIRFF